MSTLHDLPSALWISVAGVVLALAIVLHTVFPRYEWRLIGEDGHALMISDKWAGQFQRANYTPEGGPSLKGVGRPF